MTASPSEPIRLLLLDDHGLFRESLSRLLATEPEFHVVASCTGVAEALAVLSHSPVDVVLLDFDLGSETGNAFLRAARQAGFAGKVLMVTAGMDAAETSLALKLGAAGIFYKHNPPSSLTGAIRSVHAGESWMPVPSPGSMSGTKPRRPDLRRSLTDREQFVLQRLFEGLPNKEIAAQIGVSESAVKATLQQLFQKTGVRTRSQLVRFALESSLGMTLDI